MLQLLSRYRLRGAWRRTLAVGVVAAASRGMAIDVDPCTLALLPHDGGTPLDREIRRHQERASGAGDLTPHLERLGWAFIAGARAAGDSGLYKLAESCALCIETRRPGAPEALLLRGHVLQNLHRFREAEALGRELVARRGLWLDQGLLGDSLLEQGKLGEAAAAYQAMMDQRPGPEAYCRAAQLRWLKGDLAGAIEVQRLAAAAAGTRNGEMSAWMLSRLALLELQAGGDRQAQALVDQALALEPEHAQALKVRGQILLARGELTAAVEPLARAASLTGLPDAQWAHLEALRASGRGAEADAVEARLLARGAVEDPRTFSLYLATCGKQPGRALELARRELEARQDVFTQDAVAWASLAAGDVPGAREAMARALAEGTSDARLFLHAAAIAHAAGQEREAAAWIDRCRELERLLLPSEKARLARLAEWKLEKGGPVKP